MRRALWLLAFVVFPTDALAEQPPDVAVDTGAAAGIVTVGPEEDWCAIVNSADFGETVRLLPGEHAGPCVITSWGVTVEASSPLELPQIGYEGADGAAVTLAGGNLKLRRLAFGPTEAGVHAIDLQSGDNTIVEECTFWKVGGNGIAARSGHHVSVTIRRNLFTKSLDTAIHLGCHAGEVECASSKVLVEDNLVDGVANEGGGHGILLEPDTWGSVEDNVVHAATGAGIIIHGSHGNTELTTLDGNLVFASQKNASLEILGGPAIVVNNIIEGGPEGGIASFDFGGMGLHRKVTIAGNTVVADGGQALQLTGWESGQELLATGNALWQMDGGVALPDGLEGLTVGNVVCTDPGACWVDAAALDVWPVDGPLTQEWAPPETVSALSHDYCGNERLPFAHAGAMQRISIEGPGPRTADFKKKSKCSELTPDPPAAEQPPALEEGAETAPSPDEPGPTPDATTQPEGSMQAEPGVDGPPGGDASGSGQPAGEAQPDEGDGGCGCDTAPSRRVPAGPPALLVALCGLAVVLRRRYIRTEGV